MNTYWLNPKVIWTLTFRRVRYIQARHVCHGIQNSTLFIESICVFHSDGEQLLLVEGLDRAEQIEQTYDYGLW